MLPSDMETEENDKVKLDVWFFQDTSGSCSHLAERFFKAARSIPPNKFNVKLHCFDTRVYPMSDKDVKEGKLYGFGGTTFTCIENYINQAVQKNGGQYQHSVWVITDGYGDKVNCTNAKQWHWFLSADYKECIPPDCKVFKLEDYE
jgi:predicted metal-dependent peptidase